MTGNGVDGLIDGFVAGRGDRLKSVIAVLSLGYAPI